MLSNISGFPEFLPKDQIAFNRVVDTIRGIFERYGFSPIDTPAVEKVATLLSKGNDHEIYGLHRLADEEGASKKDLALRFDLTVPLARYVAQHYAHLTFPFRRYHIAPVWRGERPQAGRYRQFYQCDIDVVAENDLALIYDAELLSMIYDVFTAIGVQRFVVKINNRRMLTSLIQSFGVAEKDVASVLRVIDKVEKISEPELISELIAQGLAPAHVESLIKLISLRLSNAEWLSYLRSLSSDAEFLAGVDELSQVIQDAYRFGVPDAMLQIDPSLARGLQYYTGTIYETKLLDFPELGSVCGGGRYANLAGAFTNKKLPGVGISIGISRLIPKLMEMGVVQATSETPAWVMVSTQNKVFMEKYLTIAKTLREAGIGTEVYLADKGLGAQMKYAAKKGFRFVVIADEPEFLSAHVMVRDMEKGEQVSVPIADLPHYFHL